MNQVTADSKINQDVWKRLYQEGKNDLKYPNDLLVRLGYNLLPSGKKLKILDFGFGTGANALHFGKLGHEVHGIEISQEALTKTQAKFKENDLPFHGQLYTANTKLPYESHSFDVIISWQVLYYNNKETLKFIMDELKRVLRPDGKFIFSIAAPGDISHKMSSPLGQSLYQSQVPDQEGCILYIPQENELKDFSLQSHFNQGFFEFSYSTIHAKHWILTSPKE